MLYPPYFLQETKWAEFWQEANLKRHKWYFFKKQFQSKIEIQCIIYEYPWHSGNFWYLPKGPVLISGESLNYRDLSLYFVDFFNYLLAEARKSGVVFLKADFDNQIMNKILIAKEDEVLVWLKNSFPNENLDLNSKIIQYLSTMTLDLDQIVQKKGSENASLSGLNQSEFYNFSESFWLKTSQNIRRYIRKSFSKNWQVDTAKTEVNFEDFWQVYYETSKRQDFAIHTKEYTKKLFEKDFSHLIILRSQDGKPHCVWLGIKSTQTLTYLYGGNTEFSFKNFGQYLVHLEAVRLAVILDLPFYDLGGYDPTKGFGKFKEGFKGQIRNFFGPYNFILQPSKYRAISISLAIYRFFRKLKKKVGR